jgi:hypothetical protein
MATVVPASVKASVAAMRFLTRVKFPRRMASFPDDLLA